ncbi:MAG: murein hydrolase activator EnvC family protein [Alphaproteobacteria bacterium]
MRICIFILGLILLTPALAQSPPTPQSKRDTIETLEQREQGYRKEEKALKGQKAKVEQDLKSTRNKLVSLAKSIQKNETLLQSLETQITTLSAEKETLNQILTEDKLAISRLVLAMERLRRLPPQAMIAKPDAPIETARSAMLMQDIIPTLNAKKADLQEKLTRMATLEEDLLTRQNRARVASKKLEKEQADLEKLLKERQTKFANINRDLQARQSKIKAISAQAQSLSDLVIRLEEERTRGQQSASLSRAAPLPKLGQRQLPLSGIIRTRFNETDDFGAKSKGISIEGHGGALIVAPMGGVVRFAGYFKNYGNMVILEHKDGYHTLIAGLEKIDTNVDQSLLAGEPLGKLYKGSNGKPPQLYFELRHNGKAINPAKKFKLTSMG